MRALLANIPGLENHIVFDEAKIVAESDAPWCYVWLSDEDIQSITIGEKPKKERSTSLQVDLLGRDRFEVTQQCEGIGAQIEDRIDSDPKLGGLLKSNTLRGIKIERSNEAPIQRYRMTYNVIYWTEAGTATATESIWSSSRLPSLITLPLGSISMLWPLNTGPAQLAIAM